jgi:molecular chaperone GrpE
MDERGTPEGGGTQSGVAAGGTDPAKDLSSQQELDKARAETADYLDQLRRARADYANYKRRCEQERSEVGQAAGAALILKLLPVLDDMERAFKTLPPELSSLTWTDGMFLIYRKLQGALESLGLTLIDLKGAKFDPALHEAVTHEPSPDREEGDILGEVQKGYKLGDRVLRPSLVRVAKKQG